MRISDWSSDVCSSDLQEGRPFDPHIGAAVILFLDPGAERLAHRAILVGGEANGQTVFVAELAELRRRIARYRQHLCVQMRELGREAREILRLGRAARRIGLGIENRRASGGGRVYQYE